MNLRTLVLFLTILVVLVPATSVLAESWLYGRDAAGRLTYATNGAVILEYEYDASGNHLVTSVPEPSVGLLLGAGILGICGLGRRRRLAGHSAKSRRGRRTLVIAFLALPLVSIGEPARAHLCGFTPVEIGVGKRTYFPIFADVFEFQPTDYEIALNGNPAIATASPGMFSDYLAGVFTIKGIGLGSTGMIFDWSYPPTGGAGFCPLNVEVVADPPPATAANHDQAATAGDPVNLFTGEFVLAEEPDLDLGGPMPLRFQRYYASGMAREGLAFGRLGRNWFHNWEARLFRDADEIQIITWRGRRIDFTRVAASWVYMGSQAVPFQLAEDGADFVLADPRDDRLYRFDSGGKLISVSDGKGNVHTLTYVDGALNSVSDGLGRTLSFTYNFTFLLGSVSDGTRTATFQYDTFQRTLLSATDAASALTSYTYDFSGNAHLVSWTRPEMNTPVTNTYDAEGRVTTQTDAFGSETTFTYAPPLTTMTDPLMFSRIYEHDSAGRLVRVTDEQSRDILYTYDAMGRRATILDRKSGLYQIGYHDPSGKVASATFPDATVETRSYAGRTIDGVMLHGLTQIVYPDTTMETFTLDSVGNVTRRVDQIGEEWLFTHDSRGQVLTETNPSLGVTTFGYNADGTLASVTTHSGGVTTFTYDGLRRRASVVHPDTTTRSFTYDARDRVLTRTNERGGTRTFTYDGNGNLRTTTHPSMQTEMLTYDALDRMTVMTDTAGETSFLAYNPRGEIESITDREGNTLTFAFDSTGYMTSLTDPMMQAWAFTYDEEGVVTSRSNPFGETDSYVPDEMNRLTSRRTPLMHETTYVYDDLGRPTRTTRPEGDYLERTFDLRGDLIGVARSATAVSGVIDRNELGRVEKITDPNLGEWNYGRDAQGRLANRTDPLGNLTSYGYDGQSRATSVTFPGALGTIAISYDGLNAVTNRTHSDGLVLDFTYDAAGLLDSATGLTLTRDSERRLTESNGLTMTRTPEGLIESLTLAPGRTINYVYDDRNNLVEVSDWVSGVTTFAYDTTGRISSVTRPNGLVTSYEYDDDSWLERITDGPLSDLTIVRDANARVTQTTRVPAPVTSVPSSSAVRTFDAAHRVVSVPYQYDELGRRTMDLVRSYTWDLGQRLTSYTAGANTVTMGYDAMGMRTSRTEAGLTRSFVWNYGSAVPSVAVERVAGADAEYHVYTPGGQLLHTVDATTNARRFYHFDQNGNTILLTNDAGGEVASYGYGPFGELIAVSGTPGDNRFTWQGQLGVMSEGSGGLYYLRARYYDSANGRFLSRDPITAQLPDAMNPYQYGLNDPLTYYDPYGLSSAPVKPVPTQAPPEPGSSNENPKYISDDEFKVEVDRMKEVLRVTIKEARFKQLDLTIPAAFDSKFKPQGGEGVGGWWDWRGETLNGGQLNYYFQGMYWAELGVPKTVMNAAIYSWKGISYFGTPASEDMYAACQGYDDHAEFWLELREEFNEQVDSVTSIPRRIHNSVAEKFYSVRNWFSPPPPSGPPSILPR